MSLRLRFFAVDADEHPGRFRTAAQDELDATAAEPDPPATSSWLVYLGRLSASDADEDALGALCASLSSHTGRDFDSEARSIVALEELASFGDAVDALGRADGDVAGWLDALRRIVAGCRAGYAHLGWDLLWDQAGVADGPDEQATAALVAPAEQVRGAIDGFFGLTAGDDGR